MKTSLITLLMLAGLTTASFGASAEAELKALNQQWFEAYVKGDTAFLKTVEAEDWMQIDPEGTVTNKADDIKAVGDKSFAMKSAVSSDVKVRMLGENHAYLTGVAKIVGAFNGQEFSGDYRFTDIFEKKNGKWQAIASQITKVRAEK